jgi:hypothetical protein
MIGYEKDHGVRGETGLKIKRFNLPFIQDFQDLYVM